MSPFHRLIESPQEFKMLFQAREDALQSLSSPASAARHQAKDTHGQPVGDRGPPERDQVRDQVFVLGGLARTAGITCAAVACVTSAAHVYLIDCRLLGAHLLLMCMMPAQYLANT